MKSVNYDAISLCLSIPEGQTCPLVAGSVGPYGAFLHDGSEYTGAYAQKMSVEVSVHQLLKLVTSESEVSQRKLHAIWCISSKVVTRWLSCIVGNVGQGPALHTSWTRGIDFHLFLKTLVPTLPTMQRFHWVITWIFVWGHKRLKTTFFTYAVVLPRICCTHAF